MPGLYLGHRVGARNSVRAILLSHLLRSGGSRRRARPLVVRYDRAERAEDLALGLMRPRAGTYLFLIAKVPVPVGVLNSCLDHTHRGKRREVRGRIIELAGQNLGRVLTKQRRAARRRPLAVEFGQPTGKTRAPGYRMIDLLEEAARLYLFHRGDLVDPVDLAHRYAVFLAQFENLFAAVRGAPSADPAANLAPARLASLAPQKARIAAPRHFHQLFDLHVGG